MKYVSLVLKAEVEDKLWGTVSDEVWEKYQNGEITTRTLYSLFEEDYSDNRSYELKEIEDIREEDAI